MNEMEHGLPNIEHSTVMGLDGSSLADSLDKHLEPPKFVTKKTNKGRYAIELKRWVTMIGLYAEDEREVKCDEERGIYSVQSMR